MSIVKGEGVMIKFYNGSDMVPFACARSITCNLKQTLIAKSTIGSGDWQEFEVSSLGWDFTIEGIMYLDKSGFDSVGDLIDIYLSKNPCLIQFFITDTTGNQVQMSGYALLPGLSPNGSVNNVGSLSVTGQGTGRFAKGKLKYGAYPLLFQVIDTDVDVPTAGQTTLNLVWNAAVPPGDDYTVKILDNTTSTTTTQTGGASNTMPVIVNSSHTYTLSIKSNYFDETAESDYSPTIDWP